MIAWLVGTLASASDPSVPPQPTRDPLELQRSALALGAPSIGPSGALRYPLQRGSLGVGLVALYLTANEAEADAVFDGLARTGATHWPPLEESLDQIASRTLGDGRTILLARVGTAVAMIKNPAGRATVLLNDVSVALSAAPSPSTVVGTTAQ